MDDERRLDDLSRRLTRKLRHQGADLQIRRDGFVEVQLLLQRLHCLPSEEESIRHICARNPRFELYDSADFGTWVRAREKHTKDLVSPELLRLPPRESFQRDPPRVPPTRGAAAGHHRRAESDAARAADDDAPPPVQRPTSSASANPTGAARAWSSFPSPSEPPAACGRCGDLERRVAEERQRVAGVEALAKEQESRLLMQEAEIQRLRSELLQLKEELRRQADRQQQRSSASSAPPPAGVARPPGPSSAGAPYAAAPSAAAPGAAPWVVPSAAASAMPWESPSGLAGAAASPAVRVPEIRGGEEDDEIFNLACQEERIASSL